MKTKLFLTLFIGTGLALAGYFYFSPSGGPDRLTELQKKKILTTAEMKELRTLSRIEKRKNGWAKPDKPDEFITALTALKTAPDQSEPGYAPNYRMTELTLARNRMQKAKYSKSAASSATWIERGPWNNGGRTRGLLIDPDDASHNTWFAGSVGGGIWKTTDAGVTWNDLSSAFPNLAVTALAMPASSPSVIYAGTGEGFGNVDGIKGDGIFKSVDKGQNWTQISSTAGNTNFQFVNRIIADPNDANVVLAATNKGIFRTTDGGGSFSQVYTNANRTQQIVHQASNFKIQYAAVNRVGVIRSTDGGQTWSSPGSGIAASGRIEIAVTPLDTALVYAVVEADTASVLYRSTNAGQTFTKIPVSFGYQSWLGAQGWYDNTLTVHPYDSNILYVGGIDLHRLVVSGNSAKQTKLTHWYEGAGYPYVHADKHGLYTVKLNESAKTFRLISTNDGGVEYSDDAGVTWKKTLNGYLTTQFYGVDKAPGSDEYFAGSQDNGTWLVTNWTSIQSTWADPLGGDGFASVWHHGDGNKVMGSLYNNILYRSVDRGENWEEMNGIPQDGPFITWIGESNIDPDLLFVLTGSGVYRTDNFGDSWNKVTISGGWGFTGTAGKVEISRHNPQIVWAGHGMNTGTTPRQIMVSVDGGNSFSVTKNFASIGLLSGLASHPLQDSTAFALFSVAGQAKVLRTKDLGQTWTDLSKFSGGKSQNGFPDVATYSLVVMPHNPSEIWAGTEIGIFVSTDEGATWNLLQNGLPSVSVWDMKVVDDQVVIATHGRGVWTATIPELASVPLPTLVKAPRLNSASPDFSGNLNLQISFREKYDSVVVFANEIRVKKIASNSVTDTTIIISGLAAGNQNVVVGGYKNKWNYKSSTIKTAVISLLATKESFYTNMNLTEDLSQFFVSSVNGVTDFISQKPTGFPDRGLTTRHPYSEDSDKFAMLRVPIIVKNTDATLTFKNIAIVEPGEPGSVWGSSDFYDYVIVEGSKDGVSWIPLGPGYDSRKYSDWLTFFNATPTGTPSPSLLKTETYNLRSKFDAGDTVVIRFRLFSDPFVTGWGWYIDDISIQYTGVSVPEEENVPDVFVLNQNYPNPFNPSTTVSFSVPMPGLVAVTVHDALGRQIRTLANSYHRAGKYSLPFDGTGLSSGVYFVRLKAGGVIQTKKMTLLK